MKIDPKDNILSRLEKIEYLIGTEKIGIENLSTLVNLVVERNERALFIYGLYLLIECNDEKAALEWIKKTKINKRDDRA